MENIQYRDVRECDGISLTLVQSLTARNSASFRSSGYRHAVMLGKKSDRSDVTDVIEVTCVTRMPTGSNEMHEEGDD